MKKTAASMLLVIGSMTLILFLIIIFRPAKPATAQEPTPTPAVEPQPAQPDKPLNQPCRLIRGSDCDFTHPQKIKDDPSAPQTYPALGARGVPTYTLVSLTFNREMEPRTLNPDTFQLSLGSRRLNGTIAYIAAGKMAVFDPETPLNPATTYTARVTGAVRDRAGRPLAADLVWSFTTSTGPSAPVEGRLAAGASPVIDGLRIYFGDLHSHTGYSDGQGTPADAFMMARANGLHFLAVSEHGFMLTPAEWQDILVQANASTTDGQFVGLRSFEYTNLKGHINVFNTDTFVQRDDPNYATLPAFYNWLAAQPTAIAQFNHPLVNEIYDWNFNDFAYYPLVDQKIVLRELSNAEQYYLSLDSGWHLASLGNSDTHQANWGVRRLMGLLAPTLTKAAILDALKARRTFFVSPDDPNLAVMMRANDRWMGSAIPQTAAINFTINVHDPSPSGQALNLVLYDRNVPVAQARLPGAQFYTWTPSLPAALGHYYYVEVFHDNWSYSAYSSPIWVERPPVAEAGAAQVVAPGMVVTLDGGGSFDPDGDALAYQWTQQSGAAVSLAQANQGQAAFIAPNTPDNMVFRLDVTDPGGLSAFDTTPVTVTGQPVLAIAKTGPAAAEPDELIVYTLTITNFGLADAADVIVTDALPTGAAYVSGGTLLPGNVVSWTIPNLPGSGGTTQVSFTVTLGSSPGLANVEYGATCANCIPAVGDAAVLTNPQEMYLPVIGR